MNKNLAQKAVSCAIKGNWQEALELNKSILKTNPNDVDALNRAARAHAELGNLSQAKQNAQKVIKLDSYNTIALKSLTKWKTLKKGSTCVSGPTSPQVFLEEPGKTKIVPLLHLASLEVLAKLDAGDELKINTHAHRISVNTREGAYIGRLSDDLSARLHKLINHGNEYKAFVKSVDKKDVKAFIKETKRSPKLASIPSFSTEKVDYVSFTSPDLVHKNNSIPQIEEEE